MTEGFYVGYDKKDLVRNIYLYNSSVVRTRIPSVHYCVSWMIVSVISETKENLEETVIKLGLPLEELVTQ